MIDPIDKEFGDLEEGEIWVMNMAALEATLEAIRGQGPASRATALARQALVSKNHTSLTLEDVIVKASLRKISGGLESSPKEEGFWTPSLNLPWTSFVYETIGASWLHWLSSRDESGVGLISRLEASESNPGGSTRGAIELLSLKEWGRAVEALSSKNEEEARKYFERSVEIGAQIGSDSNMSINWTYAASIFRL